MQEAKVGYYRYYWTVQRGGRASLLTPEYQFPGLTLGLNWNYPNTGISATSRFATI